MRSDTGKNLLHAVKISSAAIIAVLLARALGLQNAVSAGIVAVLSVAFTKKETLETARNRFLAFIAALLICALCFYTIGFSLPGFFVYLVFFIILCQFMGWNSAMAMDSVLVSHFLVFGEMTPQTLANEAGLFIIGVGTGILANLFLRRNLDYMECMKRDTDELIRLALHRMSIRIMDPQMPGYTGGCFKNLNASIEEASALAHANYMNQFSKEDRGDMAYIAMRKRQADTLYEIYKHLSRIRTVPVTAGMLSYFFEKVSMQYSMDNTAEDLLKDFGVLDLWMKKMPLPKERSEFEDRARLFAVMRGLEEFLQIKKEYMDQSRKV